MITLKPNGFIKILCLSICLVPQLNLYAADPVTVHVEPAGSLSSLIADDQKYEITNLTLTGNLNGTDILFIHELHLLELKLFMVFRN